jgi:hypothetical protein
LSWKNLDGGHSIHLASSHFGISPIAFPKIIKLMNPRLLPLLLYLFQITTLSAAETNHAAQLKQLTEQRDNAVKTIDAKYHELLRNLQKTAATASDFETVTAIQKILSSTKKTATMQDYFPAGSKWKGFRITGGDAEKKEYLITQSDATTATMEYDNVHGRWVAELTLIDDIIKLTSLRAIGGKDLNVIYDIKVSGRMETLSGKKRVELKGDWKWKSPVSNLKGDTPDIRMVIEEP